MLRDITNIIGHPVVLIAALLLGCYLFFFSGYNDAGPRTGLNERNEMNERNEKIFNPPSRINYVNSATAGQQDSRTAGQQDSSGRFSTVNAFTWPAAAQAALPEPAPDKAFYQEGHWIGLETVALTPSFAAANNIKPGIEGVLVDEVTLLSAETGVMAGDVIVGIGGNRVRDLAEFLIATKMVKDAGDAMITVYRNGGYLDINVHAPDALGFAQMEAAPMITPGATSPHGYYGQCDDCHAIAPDTAALNSAHLGKDLGDTFAPPPPITRSSDMPHRYRGVCQNCHIIRGDVK